MTERAPGRWLLIIHQIPPEPAYLRVKVGRRLARLGALALKNSVYVLPRTESSVEDFQWVRRELVEGGGEATVVDAHFVDGVSDAEIETLFRNARDEDYREVIGALRAMNRGSANPSDAKRAELAGELARQERRLEEIAAIDFFGASGREVATGLVNELRRKVQGEHEAASKQATVSIDDYRKRVWVTRTGIHVDRIASAWLIRRFIDPDARFKFVPPSGYKPAKREVRFDMAEAEFSHEGDACTFETLSTRMNLRAPGLRAIAEIVHDIDLKDGKFNRPETQGVAALIAGLALAHRDDTERLDHGGKLFDHLLRYFARKRS